MAESRKNHRRQRLLLESEYMSVEITTNHSGDLSHPIAVGSVGSG